MILSLSIVGGNLKNIAYWDEKEQGMSMHVNKYVCHCYAMFTSNCYFQTEMKWNLGQHHEQNERENPLCFPMVPSIQQKHDYTELLCILFYFITQFDLYSVNK